VRGALAADLGEQHADADPLIRPSQFADYQSKRGPVPGQEPLGRPPREIATAIAARLSSTGLGSAGAVAAADVSGPGFVNISCADEWIAGQASSQLSDLRLGVPAAEPTQRISGRTTPGPNVAKELHAGHLRPTVVGEAIVRVLEYLGHTVIRAAHLGRLGVPQFGHA